MSSDRNPIKVVFSYEFIHDPSYDEREGEAKQWGTGGTKVHVETKPVFLRFVNGRGKVLSAKEMASSAAKGK